MNRKRKQIFYQAKFKTMENNYWNQKGELQDEYDSLFAKLVPIQGEAKTTNGELIRSISKLYWDYCNNGNLNAVDADFDREFETCYECIGTGSSTENETEECDGCGGSGEQEHEIEGDYYVTEHYQNYIDFIQKNTKMDAECDQLQEQLIRVGHNVNFNESEMSIYETLVTGIIRQVMASEKAACSQQK